MKLQCRSQTGFTALHILLLFVLLGIIGFAGWKVYDANKSIKNTSSSAATTSTEKPTTSNSSTPDGFIRYQNKELGFRFAYPKEWGGITVEDARMQQKPSNDIPADQGKRWLLNFSKESNASLGLTSKDWAPSVGRGGSCTFADGSAYKSVPNPQAEDSDIAVQKILNKTDKYFITENASVAYCNNLAFYIDYIFKDNPTYLTLQFEYNVRQFKDENEFNDYKINPGKYVKPELVKTVEQIAKTIEDF